LRLSSSRDREWLKIPPSPLQKEENQMDMLSHLSEINVNAKYIELLFKPMANMSFTIHIFSALQFAVSYKAYITHYPPVGSDYSEMRLTINVENLKLNSAYNEKTNKLRHLLNSIDPTFVDVLRSRIYKEVTTNLIFNLDVPENGYREKVERAKFNAKKSILEQTLYKNNDAFLLTEELINFCLSESNRISVND
jgi:hypothetical protein